MHYYLGVDLGTSGTKTVLYSAEGQAVAQHTIEYPMYQPRNGWAEQDPQDWANAAFDSIQAVLRKSGVDIRAIKALGISGQMHGLVMLDEQGSPLRRSILWCDGRTGEECREITARVGQKRLVEISANPALTGFTAGKILWVRRHEPELYARCRKILLPKDYVRFCLTGVYGQDYSDASGTNLLDVGARCWSQEILRALEIDEEWLPRLYESAEPVGHISRQAAERCGLSEETLVVAGAGDNAAAAIGTGICSAGKAFITLGTSGVIFAHSDRVIIDPQCRVHTFCSAIPRAWAVMSCTLAAGLSYRWLRDTVFAKEVEAVAQQGEDPYLWMNRLAEAAPIGANKLLYLPYLMGERSPLLDEKARGAFVGLSAMHQRGDLARAVLEGVSYSQKACYDVIRGMGIDIRELLSCGGGARSPLWRQMLADLLQCEVKTAKASSEGPALGAAILAGVGCGDFRSIEEACVRIIVPDESTLPRAENTAAYQPYYALFQGLYPALRQSYARLSELE